MRNRHKYEWVDCPTPCLEGSELGLWNCWILVFTFSATGEGHVYNSQRKLSDEEAVSFLGSRSDEQSSFVCFTVEI